MSSWVDAQPYRQQVVNSVTAHIQPRAGEPNDTSPLNKWNIATRPPIWWSDPGWEAREHVVDAAERAGAVENDPRALTVLAYAASIECGSVVTKWLDSAPSSAETNAELARGCGSAAVVIGSF